MSFGSTLPNRSNLRKANVRRAKIARLAMVRTSKRATVAVVPIFTLKQGSQK